MKKCPTCDKTFEDSMRFCQVDGTPLVDDAPAFDPYATMVAPAGIVLTPEPTDAVPVPSEPIELEAATQIAAFPVTDAPIAEPDDVLDLPEASDPLKTMYVSEEELREAMGATDLSEEPNMEIPDVIPAPPSFIDPVIAATPPPSPFAETPVYTEPVYEEPIPAPYVPTPEPQFTAPEPVRYDEPVAPAAPTFEQNIVAPQSPADWAPPSAPEAAWQNQEIGSNTPFAPPVVSGAGQSKTLAIVSLVLGLLGLLCCSNIFVVGLAAIITGFMANSKASGNPNEYGGKGLAWAGIILGAISFLLGAIYWLLVLSGIIKLPNF